MGEDREPCVLSFYLGLPSVAGGQETDWCFTTNTTQGLELAAGSKKKKRGVEEKCMRCCKRSKWFLKLTLLQSQLVPSN